MNHELYMQRCIHLANNARGYTSPNPLVGAVVVHNDKIIGEGWHHKSGEPHAEVNAINSVEDQSLLTASTIYVSLEPCAHFGKTPPCSDLIIEKKIPKVVIGCRDPFTEVNGRGIEKLKAAGVEVIEGILKEKCQQLNAPFFTYHTQRRPYIILKWAQTANGFMDVSRQQNEKGVNWITQPETKVLVHKWRAEVDAILVGANTVLNDDPTLTVREVEGPNPVRLVLDPNDRINGDFKIFNSDVKTYIFPRNKESDGYVKLNAEEPLLPQLMAFCYNQKIQSLLVEGGAYTLQQFLNEGLWDEARVLSGTTSFDKGLNAPAMNLKPTETLAFGKDTLNIYRP